MIEKIRLINFKKFRDETIFFQQGRNIFVGENGVGKSSILQAIGMVLSGSYSWVESAGIDSLLNNEAIQEFYNENKDVTKLPVLEVELYFSEYEDPKAYELNGKYNSTGVVADGIKLIIEPDFEGFSEQIQLTLENEKEVFPFEFYKVEFSTFSGKSYNSFHKAHKMKHTYVDTSTINYSATTKKYIEQIYFNQVKVNKQVISQAYREVSDSFTDKMNSDYLDNGKGEYLLRLKPINQKSFTSILDAHKNNVSIENLGMGEQVMIGVESSIYSSSDDVKLILLEEPENHLSHLNVQKLIDIIELGGGTKQLFIATHSNTIAAKLALRNTILINDNGKSIDLSNLSDETSRFFMKSPTNNVLNFILSKKAILIEGDAEYILMNKFFEELKGNLPHNNDIAILSCGGKTFKRYLEVAEKLDKKVVVVTDNDKDYEVNIEDCYSDYSENDKIKIKADPNNNNHTFEVCLYDSNKTFYDETFKTANMRNGVLNYMLNNKAEAAFRLLENYPDAFVIPSYIEEAINWIVEQNA